MEYGRIKEGTFLLRKNRFVAEVMVDGVQETVHVKNTGRCAELLPRGARVFLALSDNTERKTAYDLVAVIKSTDRGELLINMDSMMPNLAVGEWLRSGALFGKEAKIRPEYTHGDSRFDFYIELENRRILLEVKGVTLEDKGVAMFPDAPTERGIKHLQGLIDAQKEGFEAYVLFVIQMKGVHTFKPNEITHKAFADKLRQAKNSGVAVLAYDSIVTERGLTISDPVTVEL